MATSGSFEISWQSKYWSTTSNPKYYHWKGNWSKSGNTITLSGMQLWLTFTQSSWGTGTDTVTTTGGSAQSVTFNPGGGTTSNVVSLNDSSFSVSNTQTSATIACYIDGEETGSTTINFDATIVAPTTPTVSAISAVDALAITWGTTSFGNPSTGTVTLYGGTVTAPTTSLASKTTTGDTTYNWTGLQPNTAYYLRARATNGSATSDYSSTLAKATLAPTPTVTFKSSDGETATFNYATEADGGYYAKTIEYSLDGGTTWNTAVTITGGAATSGTFTVTGLTSGSTYTLEVRARTTAGSGSSASIPFTAGAVHGVGPGGKAITGALGSVNGIATRISKILSWKESA